ncbi:MAG: O-antigen ligase family protein [Gammaproteobacteria bacterium]|nr:O-antigen ligase family protein [Gammaproteobacteria bacterium]
MKTFSNIPSTYTEWNQLSSYRLELWSAGWKMLVDNPVKGVGVRNFAAAYDDYSDEENIFHGQEAYHAHHPIVSIAAETGLLGLLGLFTAIFLLYRWGKQTVMAGTLLLSNPWAQILILIIFPIQSMPLLFSLWYFPFIAFALVCYLHSIYPQNNASLLDSK